MFKISLDESLKNFDKNRFITILSVFLFALLFVLEGYTMSYHTINEYRKQSSKHESLQNWGLYCLSSNKSPIKLLKLIDSSYEHIDIETIKFWEKIDSIENLDYLVIDDGIVRTIVYDKILDYTNIYESVINEGIITEESLDIYSIYVSPNFHKVEYYRVIEGRDFTDDDMVYEEGQPRAVLLGYKLKDFFDVGDIIELNANGNSYLGDIDNVPSLKVIGFLEEDSTVLGRDGYPVFDLDTYIIIPMIKISAESYESASVSLKNIAINADIHATMYKTKFLIPEGHEAEVLPQLQEALNEYSDLAKFYNIVDKKAYVERLQERTETVTNFSASITVVLSVFAFITIITTIANRISRNIKDYAIHITVGATKNSVVLYIVMEMLFVLLFGLIFGLIILKPLMNYYGMPAVTTASWITFGITFLFVLVMSAVVSKIIIQKHDICTLIK
ncbi:MAG: ABC transporter permease [Ruminococcaceae bacterium]|nr:ABC transporter permease [Oscillospiraceae bacterium]